MLEDYSDPRSKEYSKELQLELDTDVGREVWRRHGQMVRADVGGERLQAAQLYVVVHQHDLKDVA